MATQDALHPLRPFLKNWVWEHGRIGTRYLDCTDGEVKFDEGKKSHFAAEAYLYVPLGENAIDDPSADGPAIQEAGLARFLKAAQLGKPEEAGSVAEVQRAVSDCVDLALFSAYQGAAREAHARYSQEPMFEDEIRAAVVDDIRRVYVGMRAQLALYDFSVLYGLPAPLLIGDAPFIDWRALPSPALPLVSLPLGPHCLLVGAPSGRKSKVGPVVWKAAAAMGPLKDHNRHMVEQARLWLVATTDEALVAVQSRFAKPENEKPDTTKP
ncbi:hypothetical protein [Pandoraea apista]|uniref:DUF4238 domain-containing protein n=1 Tax=Pandoraea apista TaxID=93218 RepID=A0ABX9ZS52_9BURK|nr:hypothetical protein [Pandoraea apista]AJE98811.1 hypothetical protein SG18_12550 [Pandoraea apista]AKH72890.1 hypothetical protein XM39_12750 [Pandoraea apista]AKI61275.1 hypothetical protein AA956_05005 [Pandoraea apista]PTD98832.1 hypothetical protein C7830_22095 [Pandoraea apista]RRJ34508.1 hypothetical protein EIB05_03300 [Pandoraea apista]